MVISGWLLTDYFFVGEHGVGVGQLWSNFCSWVCGVWLLRQCTITFVSILWCFAIYIIYLSPYLPFSPQIL